MFVRHVSLLVLVGAAACGASGDVRSGDPTVVELAQVGAPSSPAAPVGPEVVSAEPIAASVSGGAPPAPTAAAAATGTAVASASPPRTGAPRSSASEGTLKLGAPCDPVLDGCGWGTRCDSTCEDDVPHFECVRADSGPVPHDGACSDTLLCVRGSRCVYEQGSGGRCIAYCRGDDDCPAPFHCKPSETYCDTTSNAAFVSYRECK